MKNQMVHPTKPKVEQRPRHQNHSLPQSNVSPPNLNVVQIQTYKKSKAKFKEHNLT
jgi:hypothetical protein